MLGQLTSLLSGAGAGSLGTLLVQLTADSSRLVRGMHEAELAVESSSTRMLRQTKLLAAGATTALVAVGFAAVRQAALFESSFAGVRKTVDATEEEFAYLERTFRNMAKETPASIHEINRVAEAAGQLGIQKANIAGFTKTMLQLGTATNMASDEAATSLARLANVTGMDQREFDRLGSTIVDLGNKMATTESEIVSMALRIAGAGRQIGLTEHQMLALAASLSSVGMEAEAGGTGMSRIMVEMAKAVKSGSDELEIFAQTAGMSSGAFVQAFEKDAAQAILAFLRGLKGASEQGSNVFALFESMGLEGVRLTDVLNRASLASDLFAGALDTASTAWSQNIALSEEARKRYETFNSQLQITKNLFVDLFITIGQQLLPAIKGVNSEMQSMLKNSEWAVGFGKDLAVVVDGVLEVGKAMSWLFHQNMQAARYAGIFIASVFQLTVDAIHDILLYLEKAWDALWEKMRRPVDALLVVGMTTLATQLQKMGVGDEALSKLMASIGEMASKTKAAAEGLKAADSESKQAFLEKLESLFQQWDLVRKQLWEDIASGVQVPHSELDQERVAAFRQSLEDADTAAKALADDTGKVVENAERLAGIGGGLNGGAMAFAFGAGLPEMLAGASKAMQEMDAVGSPSMLLGKHGQPRMNGIGMDYATSQAFRLQEEQAQAQKAMEDLAKIETQGIEALEERKTELIEQWMEKRNQLRIAEAQLALSSTSQMFEDLGTMAEVFAGKQSDVYKAMFAASKAFAIAESIVKIQQGIANAASLGWPAMIPAVASVVAATANIVSTIQSVKLEFGGARAAGGDVTKGKAFLVGERGPELFVPEDNGYVFPNSQGGQPFSVDGGTDRGSGVIVNIINHTDITPQVSERDDNGKRVVDVVLRRVQTELSSSIREGRGELNRAMTDTFALRRSGVTGR